jgi:hypothetical protein
MKSQWLVIGLFILGGAISAFNEIGISAAQLPEPNYETIDQAQIQDLSSSVSTGGLNPLSSISLLSIGVKVVIGGAIAVLSFIPTISAVMYTVGIPYAISIPLLLIFQIPVWYLLFADLVGILIGRNVIE